MNRRVAALAAAVVCWMVLSSLPAVPAENITDIDRNSGLGWGAASTVAETSNAPSGLRFSAAQDSNHSLFWTDGGNWHVLLDSTGQVLSSPKLLGRESSSRWTGHGTIPNCVRDRDGNFHFVWDTGNAVHYRKLDAQGFPLIYDLVLRSNSYGVHGPSISLRPDGQLLIGYVSYEAHPAEYRYVLRKMDTSGNTPVGELTYPAGEFLAPQDGIALAASDGGAHILLSTGNGGIYLRTGPAGEITSRVSVPFLVPGVIAAMTVADTVILAWNGYESGQSGRIAAARITDTADVIFVTSQNTASSDASLVTTSLGEVFISWEDNRSGSAEAYYCRINPGAWSGYPANIKVPVAATGASGPAMAVDSSQRVFSAWAEGNYIRHARAYSFGFEAVADNKAPVIHPREQTQFDIGFTNTGGISDTLSITMDASGLPAGWKAELGGDEVYLAAGTACSGLTVAVSGPDRVFGPASGKLVIRAVSNGNPLNVREIVIVVTLEVRHGLEMTVLPEVIRAAPGALAEFSFEVKNTGDDTEDISLSPAVPGGAQVFPTGAYATIASGEHRELNFTASIPVNARPGDAFPLTATALSARSGKTATVSTSIIVVPGVLLQIGASDPVRTVLPGEAGEFILQISNYGVADGDARIDLEIVSGAEGWQAALSQAVLQVGPHEQRDIVLTVRAGPGTLAGERFVVRILASSEDWGAQAWTTVTAIAGARGGIFAFVQNARLQGLPGTELKVPVMISSTGNGQEDLFVKWVLPARGWRAELFSGGLSTGTIHLNAGEKRTFPASIFLPSETAPGDYNIQLLLSSASGATARLNLTASVEQVFDLSLFTSTQNLRVAPGEAASAVLHLRNFGNGPDRVFLETAAPRGWTTEIRGADLNFSDEFELPQGGTAVVLLGILAPYSSSDAWSDLIVHATSSSLLKAVLSLRIGLLLPDLSVSVSYSPSRITEGKTTLATVTVTNTGEAPARNVAVGFSVDGGPALKETISLIPPNSVKTAVFEWKSPAGSHTLRFEADPDHAVVERDEENNVFLDRITLGTPAPAGPQLSPATAALTFTGVALGALVALGGGTEYGKYTLLSFFFIPLYTKIRHDDVLDHFVRGQVYGYIKANPGEHYNSIKKALSLKNGTLVYHLKTLEREELIKSIIDGRFKRFYPHEMKVPEPSEELVLKMNHIQHEILKIIRENPGISQKEIADKIGLSTPTIHYHIDIMTSARVIKVQRVGRETQCFVEESHGEAS